MGLDLKLGAGIEASKERVAAVRKATDLLAEAIGGVTGGLEANWDLVTDSRGRALYRLKLRDWSGEVTADFAPDELSNESQIQRRVYRVWGDLLQVRARRQIKDVFDMVNTSEGAS